MVKSEQYYELGEKWFGRLQGEIDEAPNSARDDFQIVVKPDSMGFYGKEGLEDEGK